jgi:hypothetical protein
VYGVVEARGTLPLTGMLVVVLLVASGVVLVSGGRSAGGRGEDSTGGRGRGEGWTGGEDSTGGRGEGAGFGTGSLWAPGMIFSIHGISDSALRGTRLGSAVLGSDVFRISGRRGGAFCRGGFGGWEYGDGRGVPSGPGSAATGRRGLVGPGSSAATGSATTGS